MTTTTPPDANAVPLFGARSAPLKHREFRLAVYATRRPNDPPTEETFSTWEEPDTGSVMTMLGAETEGAQTAAVFRILMSTLRDDDGVSVEYRMPEEPMSVDEFDEWVGPDATEGTRYTRLPVPDPTPEELEQAAAAEVRGEEDDESVPIAYAAGDGDERLAWWLGPEGPTTNVDELDVPYEEGSSVRRFLLLTQDRARRVDWSALTELAEFMATGVADRPTKRPQPSRHGRRSTGSGASAGRPGKGSLPRGLPR